MSAPQTYLVTGSTGFIGAHLIKALTERGDKVRALVRRTNLSAPPGWETDPLAHKNVELVQGDVIDAESLLAAAEGCQRIFHLAAYAKNWSADPDTFVKVNIQGMHNVLEAGRRHSVERIVLTSTYVTFGPSRKGEVGNEEYPRITDKYFNEYEETKSIAEQQAIAAAREGTPLVIVNPARVFGPGHLTESNSLALLIDDYDRGKVPILLNRGVNVGNYVYVEDVVAGHLLAMEKGRIGERYILGGENVSLREFFRLIDRISGKKHFQIPIFRPGAITFAWLQKQRAKWFGVYPTITPGWVRMFLADWAYSSEKAERELGYKITPLEEGLRTTYNWLLSLREKK